MKRTWKKSWPTEIGSYWFYGYRFGKEGEKAPELSLVEVWHESTGKPMYITRGHFLHPVDGTTGLWQRAVLPELPTREKINSIIREEPT